MIRRASPIPFDLQPGRLVSGKYLVEKKLGSGYEGEVYTIVERATGIKRAAKFYYPQRDPHGKAAIAYARKLDALRHCPILLQYLHQETLVIARQKVVGIISELVEGEPLCSFLEATPELSTFESLHILYVLAKGIAPIHARGEYHGDLHDGNIMIRRRGIGFDVKLLDFFDLGKPARSKIYKDVLNLIEVFHTIVGGREKYAEQPPVVRQIIRGLKDSLILERFKTAGDIQRHLETLEWTGTPAVVGNTAVVRCAYSDRALRAAQEDSPAAHGGFPTAQGDFPTAQDEWPGRFTDDRNAFRYDSGISRSPPTRNHGRHALLRRDTRAGRDSVQPARGGRDGR